MANKPGAVPGTFGRTNLRKALISGGAAGNLTVTGIKTTDELIAVFHLVNAGLTTMTNITDLTAEFTISAADTINNTAGTASTNGKLQVWYHASMPEAAR